MCSATVVGNLAAIYRSTIALHSTRPTEEKDIASLLPLLLVKCNKEKNATMPIAAAAKDGNVYYKTILLLLGQRTQSTPLHQLY